jgi:hypothetical protein
MAISKPTPLERIRLLDECAEKLVQARILARDAGDIGLAADIIEAIENAKTAINDAKQEARIQ